MRDVQVKEPFCVFDLWRASSLERRVLENHDRPGKGRYGDQVTITVPTMSAKEITVS